MAWTFVGLATAFVVVAVSVILYVAKSGGIGADDDRRNWP